MSRGSSSPSSSSSPGLYLFVPLILLQTLGQSLVRVGFLDTPLLITSGSFAMEAMNPLATCVCLLLLFYTVESFERERSTRLAAIAHASPIRTGSLLLGKAAAQAAVGMAIVLAAGLAGLIAILIQGRVPVEFRPVVLVWGLLLFPTLLLWSCFVMAVQTLTRNRYTTYAVGLAVLAFTGYRLFTNEINWVGNWPLWDAVELERHQRAGVRPQGPGPEPRPGGRPGDLLPCRHGPLLRPPRGRRDRAIIHRLRPRPLLARRACGWPPGRSSRWSRAPGWRSR